VAPSLIVAGTDAAFVALFGGAGWLGLTLSDRMCPGITPFDDGPAPGKVNRWFLIAVTALIGLGVAQRPNPLDWAVSFLVVAALAGGWATDIRTGILPDVFTLVPLGLVAGIGLIERHWSVPLSALGIALPFALVAFFSKGRAMGWGDVKLVGLAGAVAGFLPAMPLLSIACLVGAITAKIKCPGKPFALGPYLAVVIGLAVATISYLR
jgi:prepilin signal peptidase PulO-like enzyme (type II secretory pathway)